MAKNLKRQSTPKHPRTRKSVVNGHGLAHDDGIAPGDDQDAAVPAARGEEEPGWTDESEEPDPHGDEESGFIVIPATKTAQAATSM